VRPHSRRRGHGRALAQAALDQLGQSGAEQVFLDVEDGNLPAIKLYEALDFAYVRRRKLYYRQKDGSYTDALVMMHKIA